MKRMKVLFAVNDLRLGGAQNMVVEQANAAVAGGTDAYLLTVYRAPEPTIEKKVALPPGRYRAFSFKGPLDLRAFITLYRYLKRERFDAVITNLFDTNLIVRSAAILARTPVILSWEHNIYTKKKRWQIVADKFLARFTYRVLVGAPQVKTFTVAQEHLPEEQVQIVYDAAELVFGNVRQKRAETLKKYQLPTDHFYIVGCGRLEEQKGHTYLVEAFRLLFESDVSRRDTLTLLIFGKGVLEESLREQVARSGLEERVRLMGMAPMEDILAMSDIFSLISLWEGFSIALIQAMNAGCAILATSVSGSADAIENGMSGLLVAPADARAAAAALRVLIEDPGLRERLGTRAAQRSTQFDIPHQVEKLLDIVRAGLRLS